MSFVILIYDISVKYKKHEKLRNLLRQYLHQVQASSFQGFISKKNLNQLKMKLKPYQLENNSIIIYEITAPKYLTLYQVGNMSIDQNNILFVNGQKIE